MAITRAIKKRMTAVETIRRITKTMQMIATAKFTAAVQTVKRTRPYAKMVAQLVAEVSAAAGDLDNPLINGPAEPVKRQLILVVSSDRGLCGAYNSHVFRAAIAYVRAARADGAEMDLHISGKKAVAFCRFQKIEVAERHSFGDKTDYAQVEALAEQYIAAFREGKYDSIHVASMRFVSNSRQTAQILQLLPLRPTKAAEGPDKKEGLEAAKPEDQAASDAVYEFSPSATELLDDLLPLAVKTTLFTALNEAVVSEQIMRMVAMKVATDNARELGKLLKRRYNRARQTQITTELMEVIGGAAALD